MEQIFSTHVADTWSLAMSEDSSHHGPCLSCTIIFMLKDGWSRTMKRSLAVSAQAVSYRQSWRERAQMLA